MRYKILYGLCCEDLSLEVESHLNIGWLPQGGPIFVHGTFYQAMTKGVREEPQLQVMGDPMKVVEFPPFNIEEK